MVGSILLCSSTLGKGDIYWNNVKKELEAKGYNVEIFNPSSHKQSIYRSELEGKLKEDTVLVSFSNADINVTKVAKRNVNFVSDIIYIESILDFKYFPTEEKVLGNLAILLDNYFPKLAHKISKNKKIVRLMLKSMLDDKERKDLEDLVNITARDGDIIQTIAETTKEAKKDYWYSMLESLKEKGIKMYAIYSRKPTEKWVKHLQDKGLLSFKNSIQIQKLVSANTDPSTGKIIRKYKYVNHLLPVEHPKEVAEIIDSFLKN